MLCGGAATPGFSVGHLTIEGDFTCEDGLLEIEIGGSAPGQFDVLTVTKVVGFTDGTIRFVFTNGFVPTVDDAIEFLTADGGVSFDPARTALQFVGTQPGSTFEVVPSAKGLVLQQQDTPEPEPSVECPGDPDATLTRAVDPEGDDGALTGGLPTHVTLPRWTRPRMGR